MTCTYYMFSAIWEIAQSADCVAQTEDPQNACKSADWHTFCRLRNTNCAMCRLHVRLMVLLISLINLKTVICCVVIALLSFVPAYSNTLGFTLKYKYNYSNTRDS